MTEQGVAEALLIQGLLNFYYTKWIKFPSHKAWIVTKSTYDKVDAMYNSIVLQYVLGVTLLLVIQIYV